MHTPWQSSAQSLVNDLQRVFATRLFSVVIYGDVLDATAPTSLSSFVLVDSLSHDDLEACARLADQWARGGVSTPLILPDEEFRRSLDTFPLEYADIAAAHQRIFGRDPFEAAVINPEDVRRACEKQIKSHILHLREGYIEARGDPFAVSRLVAASAPGFAGLLRSVARLLKVEAPTRADTALKGARAIGLPDSVVAQVLSLVDGPAAARAVDGVRLFPTYLAAVEQLARAVDTWRP
ncbi:MAG: hypothetical protein ABL986_05100 [Vicinamibacterales bacterium]